MDELMHQMSLEAITLESLIEAMGRKGVVPPMLAMPYFSGPVFDVDLLARDGQPLYVIARRRFHPRTTPFRGCVLDRNPAVIALATQILEALRLHYLHDVDIMLDAEGQPHLLEVNPRLSGSVIASITAGVNLLDYLVRLALGREVPQIEIPYGKSIKPSIRTVCLNGAA